MDQLPEEKPNQVVGNPKGDQTIKEQIVVDDWKLTSFGRSQCQ